MKKKKFEEMTKQEQKIEVTHKAMMKILNILWKTSKRLKEIELQA